MLESGGILPTTGDVIGWVAVLTITAFIPVLAIFLRTYIAQRKQDRLAKTEQHYNLKNTEAYRRAVDTVPEFPLSHYLLSLGVLTVIIGTNAYLLVFGHRLNLEHPNFLLAGGRFDDSTEYDLRSIKLRPCW